MHRKSMLPFTNDRRAAPNDHEYLSTLKPEHVAVEVNTFSQVRKWDKILMVQGKESTKVRDHAHA